MRLIRGKQALCLFLAVFMATTFAFSGENIANAENPGENLTEDISAEEETSSEEDIALLAQDADDPDEDDVLGVHENEDPIETVDEEEVEAEQASTLVYLSDLEPASASIGWGDLMLDENPENGQISLRVNGAVTGFKKGVAAHAESTLIYKVSDLYDQGYRYFQTYYGVNSTKGGSVKFYMYTTTDADLNTKSWDEVEDVDHSVKSGSSAAGYIEIPLTEDMTYLKLYADPDGGNGQDHSVYGGAKFITDGYYHDDVLTVAEYDEKLREYYEKYGTGLWSDAEYEQLLLERDLVDKVGYEVLQDRFNEEDGDEYKAMIEWLFANPDFLKMYLTGDAPGGNYLTGTYSYSGSSYDSYSDSLKTMYQLWKTHQDDFDNTSNNGLYQKMIAAVSLSLTGSVKFWYGTTGGTADTSITNPDPVERYEIYKEMYEGTDLLTSYFDQLYVPEMRYIMGSPIHNNEILWGADMAKERNYNTNCYSWMYYQYGQFNYFQDKFYNEETWGADPTYDYVAKYNLNDYGITNYGYGDTTTVKYPMNWIGMVDGGTCWPIANLCQNIWSSYGRPCYICGCWGGTHEVYMAYNWYEGSDNSGRSGYGRWTVENGLGVAWQDVNYGAYDSTGWHIARLIGGWGTNSDSRYTNASYVILGQSAMNDYNNYVKAEELEMLSKVYADDEETLEGIYRAMLDIEGFHYDAWRGLVKLYAASEAKTDEDKYNLAEEMMAKSALYYYPIPLDDLLSLLKNSMSSSTYTNMVQNSEQETLRAASQTTDDEFYSAYAVQQVASGLLGSGESVIGSFSFDGENAGQIMLDQEKFPHPEYWEYSLDGGNTWSEVIHDAEVEDAGGVDEIDDIEDDTQMVVENTNVVQLTNEEIARINTEDNILIRFIQVPDYWYTIYINESAKPVKGSTNDVVGVYLNPWENQAIYATGTMEWRNAGDESAAWVSFTDAQPDRDANKEIDVRYKANGTNTAGEYITLSYDNSDNNYKEEEGYYYIPISRLSLDDYTAQTSNTRDIKYALDGSIYSFYQSVTTTDYPIYVTLKLDTPASLNKLEYQCNLGNTANGQARKVRVLTSMDGENWSEVEYIEGTDGYDNYASGTTQYLEWGGGSSASGKTPKQVYFTPVEAQYIRFEAYECTLNFLSVGDLRVYASEELPAVEETEEEEPDDEETSNEEESKETEPDDENLEKDKSGGDDSGDTGSGDGTTEQEVKDEESADDGNTADAETEEGDVSDDSASDANTNTQSDGDTDENLDISVDEIMGGVRVTIHSSKALEPMDGWDLSDDGLELTKVFTDSSLESIKLTITYQDGTTEEVTIPLTAVEDNSEEQDNNNDSDEEDDSVNDNSKTSAIDDTGGNGSESQNNDSNLDGEDDTNNGNGAAETEEDTAKAAKTSDTNPLFLYLLLLFLSAGAVTGTVVFMRRKK